jgi:osmotically-inducible protein OsmY
MPVSEQELLLKIKQQLQWDEKVSEQDINVIIDNNVVRLSGTVPSYAALRAAEADALDVEGVNQIDNQLVLRYRQETTVPSDQEMEHFIQQMFRFNQQLADDRITVIIEGRQCTLDGHVDALWKKLLAEELAYSVRGIEKVVNELTIVPTEDLQDENIANTIVATLERHHMTNPDEIILKVEEGIVSLSGHVKNRYARQAAFEIAYSTKGVREVINEIEFN